MIEKNRPAFEITNVLTWQQDNLGEGTTIVVLDEGLEAHKHMAHQVEVMTFGEVRASAPKIGHGSGVMAIIYEVAPKAKIVYCPFNNIGKEQRFDMLEWILNNSEKIDVITMSMTWYAPTAREYFDTIKWLGIPFTVASGNDGNTRAGGVSSPADFDYTLAIGSASNKFTSNASYSNGGKDLMCVAPMILAPNATMPEFSRSGTSFATPYVAGAIALYTSWRRRNKLSKFTHTDAVEFIKTNALDITNERSPEEYKVGHDYPTGWGLFRLPSEIPVLPKPEPPKEEPKPEPEKPVEVIEQVAVKLIIDAGHGGEDTGGYSGGIREKDLTLPVARRVKELLKNWNPAITRTEDTLLIWNNRAAMIKDQYDYCISVHFNIGGGTGVEAIHSHLSLRGKQLATILVDEVSTNVGIPKRQTPVFSKKQSDGQDYYYMHRLTGRTTTVILEVFFLDNDADKMYMNLEKIAQAIASGFTKFLATQTVFTPPTAMNPRTLRQYNSDIHIYETKPGMKVDVDLGTRFKLERVSSIMKDKLAKGEKVLAGINGGFFNLDGSSEHLGMLIDDGLYYQVPSINFVDFIYYKNGKTEIRNMHGYDKAELSRLQAESHWAIGTSYALVIGGKINLMLAEKFSHSKNKEPRTMIGQKADGTFVLVVTDGRVKDSAGLTAAEQAELMLSLGCINAVNLDGGGSSTMVINRNGTPVVYNELYDGFERSVGSVILVKEA